jgi:SAM-dependent methyltransferase
MPKRLRWSNYIPYMLGSTPWPDLATVRQLIARHLGGQGLEMGPGHQPFPVSSTGTQVTYVDRWFPEENTDLFPELAGVSFVQPDVIANLDVDRLKAFEDESQDFVIASHVLEHVVDPIGLLCEMHRVVRPGGSALILLPDRRRTFDAGRTPTTLRHLVEEYEAQVTEASEEHLLEFMAHTEGAESISRYQAMSEIDRDAFLDNLRQRSIHVHVWTEDEFPEVLVHAIEQLGHEWDFVDGVMCDDEGPGGIEFGYILRRNPCTGLTAHERSLRFSEAWSAWAAERREIHALRRSLETTTVRVRALEAELAAARSPLALRVSVRQIGARAKHRLLPRP